VICLYINKGRDDKDALQVVNSIFFVCIAQITLYMSATLMEFQLERTIFIREVASNMYNVLPFFISKVIVEMPILFLMPLLECSICFWAVGYRNEAFL
jgi:ABC-type multidrug transport system permease subunit